MKLLKTKYKGIYYVKNKKGVTYYYNYKDPVSKTSKRKKIFSKDKHTAENAEVCYEEVKKLKPTKENYNTNVVPEVTEFKNYLTLNELAKTYFESRENKKKRQLREYYQHLSAKEFEEDKTVQRKLYHTKKEELRYNKNVKESRLAKTNVNKLTRKHINDFIDNHLGDKSLTGKSKFNIVSTIKTIFNYSIKNEIINIKNPFENIKFKNPKRNRERVLTENEIKLLLNECKKYNQDQKREVTYKNGREVNMTFKKNYNIYLSVYFGVMTAARMGSILNIKKKDIDLKNKTVTITNQKNRMKQYQVQLTNEAIEWLEEKILRYYEPNEYLMRPMNPLLRQDPPQPMKSIPEEVYKIMDRLFNQGLNKQNNLDRDKVANFHCIRRSIATNLVKNGASIYNVMILLNHSNVEQTMEYLNINHNNLDNDINKLMSNIFKNF